MSEWLDGDGDAQRALAIHKPVQLGDAFSDRSRSACSMHFLMRQSKQISGGKPSVECRLRAQRIVMEPTHKSASAPENPSFA